MSDIDTAVLQKLAADLRPEDLPGVLQAFETDMARLSAELSMAAQAGDLGGYQRAAHSIAGASGSVGAHALAQVARQAMTRTAPGQDGVAEAAMIVRLTDRAIAALRRFGNAGAC